MPWNVEPTREELQVLLETGFLLRDARRFQDARIVFQGVQALSPGSTVAEVGLGTVAFHEGDFEKAKTHYERALERDGRDAWAMAHLGEAELFAKRPDEAKAKLERAVELDPRGPGGQMARRLLQLSEQVRFEAPEGS